MLNTTYYLFFKRIITLVMNEWDFGWFANAAFLICNVNDVRESFSHILYYFFTELSRLSIFKETDSLYDVKGVNSF